MVRRVCVLALFCLLMGCNQKDQLTKAEIEILCAEVGGKAFAVANNGHEIYENAHAIELGAVAECKLKYLAGKDK